MNPSIIGAKPLGSVHQWTECTSTVNKEPRSIPASRNCLKDIAQSKAFQVFIAIMKDPAWIFCSQQLKSPPQMVMSILQKIWVEQGQVGSAKYLKKFRKLMERDPANQGVFWAYLYANQLPCTHEKWAAKALIHHTKNFNIKEAVSLSRKEVIAFLRGEGVRPDLRQVLEDTLEFWKGGSKNPQPEDDLEAPWEDEMPGRHLKEEFGYQQTDLSDF